MRKQAMATVAPRASRPMGPSAGRSLPLRGAAAFGGEKSVDSSDGTGACSSAGTSTGIRSPRNERRIGGASGAAGAGGRPWDDGGRAVEGGLYPETDGGLMPEAEGGLNPEVEGGLK